MNIENNKEDLDEFITKFNNDLKSDSEKTKLPDSLLSENLFTKYAAELGPQIVKTEKSGIRKAWLQLAASAACFVLIFAGYYNMTKLGAQNNIADAGEPKGNTIGSVADSAKVSSAANYTQIRQVINQLYETQNQDYRYFAVPEMAVPQMPSTSGDSMNKVTSDLGGLGGGVYTTNTQVAGIDEADIVKTDGKYIYHYRFDSKSGKSEVAIVSANNLEVASTISLGDYTQAELYIYNDKLVIIDTVPVEKADEMSSRLKVTLGEVAPIGKQTETSLGSQTADKVIDSPGFAGKSIRYMPQSLMTRAVVYDIRDKSAPNMVNSIVQDGRYISSRLDGERLYLVTNKESVRDLPIDIMPAREIIPYVGNNGDMKLIAPDDIIISPYMQSANYAVVSSLNLKNKSVTTKAVLGMADKIVMSEESLFLTSTITEYSKKGEAYTSTGIAKFALNNGKLDYQAGNSVKGYIDSQFSVDEYKSNLRIATTSFELGENQNNLYVLNKKLELIGSIENLAPGERIYSARFTGDTGYIVTFKQVDPLFVIDLSNPAKPTVKGELKIPGFSEYLHPIGGGKMVGFGVNTMVNQNGGVVQDGLKLSMFNVIDPKNPLEEFNLEIGNMGTYSEVLDNHKAFMYYPQKKLIGFPANIYTATGGVVGNPWSGERTNTFSGYLVFEIKDDSFKLVGKISSNDKTDDIGKFEYDNVISRGVYVGDIVYTISNGKLMAYSLNDFRKLDELKYK